MALLSSRLQKSIALAWCRSRSCIADDHYIRGDCVSRWRATPALGVDGRLPTCSCFRLWMSVSAEAAANRDDARYLAGPYTSQNKPKANPLLLSPLTFTRSPAGPAALLFILCVLAHILNRCDFWTRRTRPLAPCRRASSMSPAPSSWSNEHSTHMA